MGDEQESKEVSFLIATANVGTLFEDVSRKTSAVFQANRGIVVPWIVFRLCESNMLTQKTPVRIIMLLITHQQTGPLS